MTSNQPTRQVPPTINPQETQLEWWRYLVWFLLLLSLSWYWINGDLNKPQTFTYSVFKDNVRTNNVSEVTLQGDKIFGTLKQIAELEADETANTPIHFVTTLPPIDDAELIPLLEQHQVDIQAKSTQSNW